MSGFRLRRATDVDAGDEVWLAGRRARVLAVHTGPGGFVRVDTVDGGPQWLNGGEDLIVWPGAA